MSRYSQSSRTHRSKSFNIEIDIANNSKLEAVLSGIKHELKNDAVIGQIKAAESFKRRYISDIKNGGARFGFQIGANYADKKMSATGEETPLNLTGTFAKSIRIHWTNRKNVAVGIDKKKVAPKISGFGSKDPNKRFVTWYISIMEIKYPITKLSFRAWGGKKRIKKEINKVLATNIDKYVKSGVVNRIK